MICSFSIAGGERWRTEVSYKSLIEDSGGHSRSVCLMRRLRMEEETRSFCAEHRACLDDWLNRGIKNGFVKLYLQPKMNLTRQEITGAEVLARYEDPRKGLLTPDDFIPQLEDAGLIGTLDLYIMERSYRLLRDLRAAGLKLIPLSVNFSKRHCLPPAYLTRWRGSGPVLRRCGDTWRLRSRRAWGMFHAPTSPRPARLFAPPDTGSPLTISAANIPTST